jgi:hypothetical protein
MSLLEHSWLQRARAEVFLLLKIHRNVVNPTQSSPEQSWGRLGVLGSPL